MDLDFGDGKNGRMRLKLLFFAGATVAVVSAMRAGSMELAPRETAPPSITESAPWQFTIAIPGWLPSTNGTIGVRGVDANIDVPVTSTKFFSTLT